MCATDASKEALAWKSRKRLVRRTIMGCSGLVIAILLGAHIYIDVRLAMDPKRRRLHEAVETNHLVATLFLLIAGEDPNGLDGYKRSPLCHARSKAGVWLLCSFGATIPGPPNMPQTPLHWAREPEVVYELVAQGADVHVRRRDGLQPLHTAHSPAIVSALLACGANLRSTYELSPLHRTRIPSVARALLDAGLVPDESLVNGVTPLHTNPDADVIRLLLQAGADVNARDSQGRTPVFKHQDSLENTRALIEAGADLHAVSNEGFTPLGWLTSQPPSGEREAVFEQLIQHGAKPDPPAGGAKSILFETHPAYFERLLELGADPNLFWREPRRSYTTPPPLFRHDLTAAMVEKLIQKGADVNAAWQPYPESGDQSYSPLAWQCKISYNREREQIVRLLVESGANVNSGSGDTKPLLLLCAEHQSPPLPSLKVLLETGADPNLCVRGRSSLLTRLIKWPEAVQLLVDHGADPNLICDSDRQAAIFASLQYPESLRILLKAGADPNAVYQGRTPLGWVHAQTPPWLGIAKILRENGALTAPPLSLANSLEEAKQLVARGANADEGLYWILTQGKENRLERMRWCLEAGARPLDQGNDFNGERDAILLRTQSAEEKLLLIAHGADVNTAFATLVRRGLRGVASGFQFEQMEFLLEHGADPNAPLYSHDKAPPMIMRILREQKVLQLLLDYGADPNPTVGGVRQPLLCLAIKHSYFNRTARLKSLLAAGADPELTLDGLTALHCLLHFPFERRGDLDECARVLLEGGVPAHLTDPEGKTVAERAEEKGFDSIQRLLSAQ